MKRIRLAYYSGFREAYYDFKEKRYSRMWVFIKDGFNFLLK